MQTPIQNLLIQFESMFQQLYSPIRVWIKGSPILLKIGPNKLNICSSGNLFSNKISLNMFAKDFKHLSPPALKFFTATPEGPLTFPIFIQFIAHCTSSTSTLLTTPSTLLASILSFHSFSVFINFSIWSFQIFYQSSKLTFTTPLSSLRKLTPTTSLFSPALCLAILNNS